MSQLRDVVQREIAEHEAAIKDHERQLKQLRKIEDLALELDGASKRPRRAESPPTRRPQPKRRAPAAPPTREPAPAGTNAERAIEALRDAGGPLSRAEISARGQVPLGSMGGVMEQLEDQDAVVRVAPPDGVHQRTLVYDLRDRHLKGNAGSNGNSNGHGSLPDRILELLQRQPLPAADVARELGEDLEDVSFACAELLGEGKISDDGRAMAPA